MNIGAAARASGVTAKMIRHYQAIGLLPAGTRGDNGYRRLSEREVHLLRFIRRARGLGFSLEQTRALLSLWQDPGRSSGDVKRLAQVHIEELDRRIAEITEMRDTLQQLARTCHGDQRPDCPILQNLGSGNNL